MNKHRVNKKMLAIAVTFVFVVYTCLFGVGDYKVYAGTGTQQDPIITDVKGAKALQKQIDGTTSIVKDSVNNPIVQLECYLTSKDAKSNTNTVYVFADSADSIDFKNNADAIQVPQSTTGVSTSLKSIIDNQSVGTKFKIVGRRDLYNGIPCLKALSTVEVIPSGPVTPQVTLDKSTLNLYTGQEKTLKATVQGDGLTQDVTWTSSDTDQKVIKLDGTGKITAVASGTATVTATSVSNNALSSSCTVTVSDLPTPISIADAKASTDTAAFAVKGVVTFVDGSNYYIQDSTAGIVVRCNGLSLNVGDEIIAKGPKTVFNELTEIMPATADDVIKLGTKDLPSPKPVTIDEINNQANDSLECIRVVVKNATMGTAASSGKLNITSLIDGASTLKVYKTPDLTGTDFEKWTNKVDVVGIVTQNKTSTSTDNGYQLDIGNVSDISKSFGIIHTPLTSIVNNDDLTVSADAYKASKVTLLYRTTGQTTYKSLTMTASGNTYTAVILKADLNKAGLEYYIKAEDGTNSIISSKDGTENSPYVCEVSEQIINVSSIDLGNTELSLRVGSKQTVTASVLPANATNQNLIWETSDDKVATVDNGTITAVGEGTADITVKSAENNTISNTCKVTVQLPCIRDVRDMSAGAITGTKGVVTFNDGKNAVYIQDGTAGICVSKYGTSLDFSTLTPGKEIKVTGTLGLNNGALQITPSVLPTITNESATVPEPKEITIKEANSGNYESQLIKIKAAVLGTLNTSTHNQPITSGTDSIVIYFPPTLTDIKAGDKVDVTGVLLKYKTSYEISGDSSKITKADLGPDTVAPTIVHNAVLTANTGIDYNISALVTDDRNIASVKVYYRTVGQTDYKTIDMKPDASIANTFTATIPKEELDTKGLEYYIEASDGTNIYKTDSGNPYSVAVSDEDITGPEITSITPDNGSNVGNNFKPVISAQYSDKSGISSIKLYIDDVEITKDAVLTDGKITYTPTADLAKGNHIVKLEAIDNSAKKNKTEQQWNFTAGEEEYNFYFGQIHAHTAQGSDGIGTYDEAYNYAENNAKLDFFALTDHSNWFDNDTSCNIADGSKSTKWNDMHTTADKYNKDGTFTAIAAYEMTWSGSTGGWGHMNTFDTPGFETRNNKSMDLKAYYSTIATQKQSISQLNHPGTTFGDFADFGFYSKAADDVVNMIEVGNGEGAVRSSGYFPSYDYYTRALDKGWHLSPTNNQDNHKGKWGDANTARTVVVAPSLSRDSVYQAMRDMRVYASEDNDLKVMYKVNGKIMGSQLSDDPTSLNVNIAVTDPDLTDSIAKVSIIADGGTVVASKDFNSNIANWDLTLNPQYNYYYVRVDEADKDIAVTSPVWTGEVVPYGLSKVEVSQDLATTNSPVDITATAYNNDTKDLSNVKVEFYKNDVSAENKIGETTIGNVSPAGTATCKIPWTPDKTGDYTIYAQAVIPVNGKDKTFTESTKIKVMNKEDVVKVVIDGAHANQYVTGDYAGKMVTIEGMLKSMNCMTVLNNDELTADDLKDTALLILTDPQSVDKDPLKKSNYTDNEIKVIQDFVARGGNVILTSKADYGDGTGEYNNSTQGNRVLEAIGTNLRVNDDEVVDNTTNGGQAYRLAFKNYTSSKYNLTKDIPDGQTYSFYSGCSVILKDGADNKNVDYLVMGHDTTETLDSDNAKDNTTVEKGKVCALAAEQLSSGSKVVVGGSTFFSDFEMTGDNPNSNVQITKNILNWMLKKPAELKKIADVRADNNKDGIPDNLGKRYAIEGTVTAQSEAVTPKNAFFEVIYVQDDTAGITVFGVSKTPVKVGQKVRISGFVDQYQGDSELQIENENDDLQVIDTNISPIQPKLLTTKDSMLEENEGLLTEVQGVVKKMDNQNLYVDDGTGVARVYVEGYIGNGVEGAPTGKWDSSIKVGDFVSAVGLASEDPDGHRLRVRNTNEIKKALTVSNMPTQAAFGKNLDLDVSITNNLSLSQEVSLIAGVYNKDTNKLIKYTTINQTLEAGKTSEFKGTLDMPAEDGNYVVKVFLWDTMQNMKPFESYTTIPVVK